MPLVRSNRLKDGFKHTKSIRNREFYGTESVPHSYKRNGGAKSISDPSHKCRIMEEMAPPVSVAWRGLRAACLAEYEMAVGYRSIPKDFGGRRFVDDQPEHADILDGLPELLEIDRLLNEGGGA